MTVETLSLRTELESKFGKVWDTAELQEDFKVKGFCYGCVIVERKSDKKLGTLEFTHMPRFYYNFMEDA